VALTPDPNDLPVGPRRTPDHHGDDPLPSDDPLHEDAYEPPTHNRYIHGRDLVPIRRLQDGRRVNRRIQRLLTQEDHLRDQIRQLDQQLLEIAAKRQQLLQQAKRLNDKIRPVFHECQGRRRRHVSHEEPLPPTTAKPTLISGRELRAICLVFLRQAGRALTLRDLHIQLHLAGYAIEHRHPAKALADALGHETDAQRCHRVKRGVYTVRSPARRTDQPPVALPDF
jgi:chorismate mutase